MRKRRSLLAAVRKGDSDMPLWKLLVFIPLTLLALTLLLLVLNGIPLSLWGVLRIALMLGLFAVPITVLAHYSGRIIRKLASGRTTAARRMLLALGWMTSGAVGSLIGLALFSLFGLRDLSLFNGDFDDPMAIIVPMTIGNAVVAVAVGMFMLFFETAGAQLKRRSNLLGQEDLLTAEFQAAQSVQQSLLPDADAHIFGFDISGMTVPAVEIGGDYYDYLSFANGIKGIIVADAAGKGIPAALVMAKFQGMAQALSIHVADADEFFVGLNDTLRVRLDRRNFITVGMLTIDFDDRCAYYRAGHNPLLIYRAATGAIEELKPTGLALGLTHGAALRAALVSMRFAMESGDVALMYSDGLSEAVSPDGTPFEDSRVAESLRTAAGRGLEAAAIRTSILSDLTVFVGDAEPHDDVTIVVVKKV